MVLIISVLGFVGLLLVIGVRTFIRWIKIHYPRRASAILTAFTIGAIATGWLIVLEIQDQPAFQSNDLITLQEPVVATTIPADREARAVPCVVDLRAHLGVMEVEIESGSLNARVESNNTSSPLYCPIGADVRIDIAWLHRPTVTRR